MKNNPFARNYHKGYKINQHGGVSALCFKRPRSISNNQRWTIDNDAVTCRKCLAILSQTVKTYSLEGLTYTEVNRQEYGGNNCVFSAGFVEGENKPEVDTMYLKLEKDGVEPTILLLRPDEMQIITWLSSGVVWSYLMGQKLPDAEQPEPHTHYCQHCADRWECKDGNCERGEVSGCPEQPADATPTPAMLDAREACMEAEGK